MIGAASYPDSAASFGAGKPYATFRGEGSLAGSVPSLQSRSADQVDGNCPENILACKEGFLCLGYCCA